MPSSLLTIFKRQRKHGSINENAEKQLRRLEGYSSGDGSVTRVSIPAITSPRDRRSSEDPDKRAFMERMRKKHYKRYSEE